MSVLAVDPGSQKCGLAIVDAGQVLLVQLLTKEAFFADLTVLVEEWQVETIILGDGTFSKQFAEQINSIQPMLPLVLVNEYGSSEEARRRYWDYHPPRGWKRLIPRGMRFPPEPYDQYVAVILAERYEQKTST